MRLFATIFMLLLGVSSTAADEKVLPAGERVTVQGILCDTQAQAESILLAHRNKNYLAGRARYFAYKWMRNSDNESVCLEGEWTLVIKHRVAIFPGLSMQDGAVVTRYVHEVRVGTQMTFYFICAHDAGYLI